MKKETYKVARERLLRELAARGWRTQTVWNDKAMVRPWALPASDFGAAPKMFFGAQSVYVGEHSLNVDMRGMTVEALIVEYYARVGA